MKLNSKSQAGTKTDSEQKDENMFVCQHSRKPNVTSRISSPDVYDKYEIKLWHIRMLQVVMCLNVLVLLTLLILELTIPKKSQRQQPKSQMSASKF